MAVVSLTNLRNSSCATPDPSASAAGADSSMAGAFAMLLGQSLLPGGGTGGSDGGPDPIAASGYEGWSAQSTRQPAATLSTASVAGSVGGSEARSDASVAGAIAMLLGQNLLPDGGAAGTDGGSAPLLTGAHPSRRAHHGHIPHQDRTGPVQTAPSAVSVLDSIITAVPAPILAAAAPAPVASDPTAGPVFDSGDAGVPSPVTSMPPAGLAGKPGVAPAGTALPIAAPDSGDASPVASPAAPSVGIASPVDGLPPASAEMDGPLPDATVATPRLPHHPPANGGASVSRSQVPPRGIAVAGSPVISTTAAVDVLRPSAVELTPVDGTNGNVATAPTPRIADNADNDESPAPAHVSASGKRLAGGSDRLSFFDLRYSSGLPRAASIPNAAGPSARGVAQHMVPQPGLMESDVNRVDVRSGYQAYAAAQSVQGALESAGSTVASSADSAVKPTPSLIPADGAAAAALQTGTRRNDTIRPVGPATSVVSAPSASPSSTQPVAIPLPSTGAEPPQATPAVIGAAPHSVSPSPGHLAAVADQAGAAGGPVASPSTAAVQVPDAAASVTNEAPVMTGGSHDARRAEVGSHSVLAAAGPAPSTLHSSYEATPGVLTVVNGAPASAAAVTVPGNGSGASHGNGQGTGAGSSFADSGGEKRPGGPDAASAAHSTPFQSLLPNGNPAPVAAKTGATGSPAGDHGMEAWDHAQNGLSGATASAASGSGELHVSMHSAELGRVDLHATLHGDEVGATISVQKSETGAALAAELPHLEHILHEQHIVVSHLNVQQGGAGMPQSNSHSHGQSQSHGQGNGQSRRGAWAPSSSEATGSARAVASTPGPADLPGSPGRLNIRV